MTQVKDMARQMKLESPLVASSSVDVRNDALLRMRDGLIASQDAIFSANAEDLAAAAESGVADAVMRRLRFDAHKLADVCAGLEGLVGLPDPIGRTLLDRELDEGLELRRVSCPIGVIGVIFEARPDALVQISSLCIKSGNCAILKGGSETMRTNRAIYQVVHQACVDAGLPGLCLAQVEARADITELLDCHGDVDLLIPRGSNAFVRYIMDHTRIPVMGHADGICHIYVDKDVDVAAAVPVVVDAKAQYPAACNAVETLLVHREAAPAFLPALAPALAEAGVTVRGTAEVAALMDCEPATEEDWSTEYLGLTLSIGLVACEDEAIDHINRYGSHHTDAILTTSDEAAERFMRLVDSAGVYRNCSTRFADGFRYGFGAEVGISTSKLHARGPVGLEGLMTYKYQLTGSGQTVGQYSGGERSFHFRDLA